MVWFRRAAQPIRGTNVGEDLSAASRRRQGPIAWVGLSIMVLECTDDQVWLQSENRRSLPERNGACGGALSLYTSLAAILLLVGESMKSGEHLITRIVHVSGILRNTLCFDFGHGSISDQLTKYSR
jgi:hypothetical protein